MNSRLAFKNKAYKVERQMGGTFRVFDSQADTRIHHTTSIDPTKPSCTECSAWAHRVPCQHMLITMGKFSPDLVKGDLSVLLENFFHPAYLVRNLKKAYAGQVINIPDAIFGLPLPMVVDLTEDDANDNDFAFATAADSATHMSNMLPPPKYSLDLYENNKQSGRPRVKRIRSRGEVGGNAGRVTQRSKHIRNGRSGGGSDARSLIADMSDNI